MTAAQGPLVRPETGEVTVDGVVVGEVRKARHRGAHAPLWEFSRMVLNRGRLVPARGAYLSREDAVAQLMAQADQTAAR